MVSRLRGNDGEGCQYDGPVLVCLAVTLTFDSSPIKGEGIRWLVLVGVVRRGGDGYCLLRISVAKSAYARRCVCLGVVVCFCLFVQRASKCIC